MRKECRKMTFIFFVAWICWYLVPLFNALSVMADPDAVVS